VRIDEKACFLQVKLGEIANGAPRCDGALVLYELFKQFAKPDSCSDARGVTWKYVFGWCQEKWRDFNDRNRTKRPVLSRAGSLLM
jgi:hypothetical protein